MCLAVYVMPACSSLARRKIWRGQLTSTLDCGTVVQEGRKPFAHSDYVRGPINLHGHEDKVDVMIEAKMKARREWWQGGGRRG